MPLKKGPGGKLLKGPGGKPTEADACCCFGCPSNVDYDYEMVIEDLDNIWGGNVLLGPFTLTALVDTDHCWSAIVAYDTCNPERNYQIDFCCVNNGESWNITIGQNDWGNQPWNNVNGAGFTVAPDTSHTAGGTTVVFEFNHAVNPQADPCGHGGSPAPGFLNAFRITFTRV